MKLMMPIVLVALVLGIAPRSALSDTIATRIITNEEAPAAPHLWQYDLTPEPFSKAGSEAASRGSVVVRSHPDEQRHPKPPTISPDASETTTAVSEGPVPGWLMLTIVGVLFLASKRLVPRLQDPAVK